MMPEIFRLIYLTGSEYQICPDCCFFNVCSQDLLKYGVCKEFSRKKIMSMWRKTNELL